MRFTNMVDKYEAERKAKIIAALNSDGPNVWDWVGLVALVVLAVTAFVVSVKM